MVTWQAGGIFCHQRIQLSQRFSLYYYVWIKFSFYLCLPTCHMKRLLSLPLLKFLLSNVWMIHWSDPRGYSMTLISFVQSNISSFSPYTASYIHSPLHPSGFLFLSVPLFLFSLLCARSRHTVLCHRVSLCFKTHNPVRNWHNYVHLMPVKILQSVHWYNEQCA